MKTKLSEVLKDKRGERSQRAVAREIGMTQATYNRVEAGKHFPSLDTARSLSAWLQRPLAEVFQLAEQSADEFS